MLIIKNVHKKRIALGYMQWQVLVKDLCTELISAAEHMNWVKSIRTLSHGQSFDLLVFYPHSYLTVS